MTPPEKLNLLNTQQIVKFVETRLKLHSPEKIELDGCIPAAVMILFMDLKDSPHVIFTKRTDLVETHKGQISFPGGSKDESDRSLLETALRETWEEIGVDPQNIGVLGQMDDFRTITNFLITPYVGIIESPSQFNLNESEVAELLIVPLSIFLKPDFFEIKKWQWKDSQFDVYFYHHNGDVIWGATAFLMNHFVDVVFGYNPAPNPIYRDPRNAHYLRQNQTKKSNP